MNLYILNDDGEPVLETSLFRWAAWNEAAEAAGGRTVAVERVGDAAEVSTVFLSLDHSHGRGGRPVLYETRVFGGPMDGATERYATRAEALAGHGTMVALVRITDAEPEGESG